MAWKLAIAEVKHTLTQMTEEDLNGVLERNPSLDMYKLTRAELKSRRRRRRYEST